MPKRRSPTHKSAADFHVRDKRSATRGFLIRFFLIFGLLSTLYYAPAADDSLRANATRTVLRGYAQTCGALLRPFDDSVTVIDRTISGAAPLQIARSCDGIQAKILLVAGMLAFPTSWRRRSMGALVGVLLLALVNVVRIVSLYFVARDLPAYFDFVHLRLWQPLMLLAAIGIYLGWVRYALRTAPQSATPAGA